MNEIEELKERIKKEKIKIVLIILLGGIIECFAIVAGFYIYTASRTTIDKPIINLLKYARIIDL